MPTLVSFVVLLWSHADRQAHMHMLNSLHIFSSFVMVSLHYCYYECSLSAKVGMAETVLAVPVDLTLVRS